MVYPSIDLKDEWIDRLVKRYLTTKSKKDLNALDFAVNFYTESIEELSNQTHFGTVVLKNMNYNLKNEIEAALNNLPAYLCTQQRVFNYEK